MSRRTTVRMEVLALAGIGLFLVAQPAGAQQGWPINGSNWSFYGGRSGGTSSYSPSYYSTRVTRSGGYPYAAANEGYYNGAYVYGFMPPVNYYYGAYSPTQNAAHIRLVVPAEAEVWFGDDATKQRGEIRHFESPTLAPGHEYVYEVKVVWRDKDGREVTRRRQLNVSANDNVSIDFTRQ